MLPPRRVLPGRGPAFYRPHLPPRTVPTPAPAPVNVRVMGGSFDHEGHTFRTAGVTSIGSGTKGNMAYEIHFELEFFDGHRPIGTLFVPAGIRNGAPIPREVALAKLSGPAAALVAAGSYIKV